MKNNKFAAFGCLTVLFFPFLVIMELAKKYK